MEHSIHEKKKAPYKDWNRMDGVYADLSQYPDKVEYYVKCPTCSQVRGGYKTAREAHADRKCGGCSLDDVEKIKKEVFQVIHQPKKKVKPLAAIVRESDANDFALPDPSEESASDFDIEGVLSSTDWVSEAVYEFCLDQKIDPTDIFHTSEVDPNTDTEFTVDGPGRSSYRFYKSEDRLIELARERVAEDLRSDPSMFSQAWVRDYITDGMLLELIGDPYEDYGEDERNLSYEEKVDKLVNDERELDYADFYDEDGNLLEETPERAKQVDEAIETWIEKTKPTVDDPWSYLEDIYGRDTFEEIARSVRLPVSEMAKDAVAMDGWQHFMNTDDIIELPSGVVVIAE